eukprot:4302517-Prymnesium_polylepis.1
MSESAAFVRTARDRIRTSETGDEARACMQALASGGARERHRWVLPHICEELLILAHTGAACAKQADKRWVCGMSNLVSVGAVRLNQAIEPKLPVAPRVIEEDLEACIRPA